MYSDKFEIHVLELPKLAKYEYPQTELLRWAQFFGARSREEIEVLAEKDEYIHEDHEINGWMFMDKREFEEA